MARSPERGGAHEGGIDSKIEEDRNLGRLQRGRGRDLYLLKGRIPHGMRESDRTVPQVVKIRRSINLRGRPH